MDMYTSRDYIWEISPNLIIKIVGRGGEIEEAFVNDQKVDLKFLHTDRLSRYFELDDKRVVKIDIGGKDHDFGSDFVLTIDDVEYFDNDINLKRECKECKTESKRNDLECSNCGVKLDSLLKVQLESSVKKSKLMLILATLGLALIMGGGVYTHTILSNIDNSNLLQSGVKKVGKVRLKKSGEVITYKEYSQRRNNTKILVIISGAIPVLVFIAICFFLWEREEVLFKTVLSLTGLAVVFSLYVGDKYAAMFGIYMCVSFYNGLTNVKKLNLVTR